jgi:hypothetical protein
MTQQNTKTVITPGLTDVLMNLKQDIFATMNCVKIGQIQSFDVNKKTAQIQLLFKRALPNGSITSSPLLVDCPVLTPQGGGGALQFPIAAGDQCLVLFSDRRIDEWLANGAAALPGDGRMHDLSDGIAIVGLNALNSNLQAYPTNKVVLSYMGSQFELTGTGWNFIGTGGAELDLSTTANLKGSGGGEIDLGSLVTIKNNITTLNTLMGLFLTMLEGLQVNGPIPLTAASVAAIEAFRTQFSALLG